MMCAAAAAPSGRSSIYAAARTPALFPVTRALRQIHLFNPQIETPSKKHFENIDLVRQIANSTVGRLGMIPRSKPSASMR